MCYNIHVSETYNQSPTSHHHMIQGPTELVVPVTNITITSVQIERMMQYLREGNDTSIAKERRSITPEESEVAYALLGLNFERPDIHDRFADSNYTPDVTLREQALRECGLADTGFRFGIRRHDIALNTKSDGCIVVKVINLTVTIGKGQEQTTVDVPDGIILFGKIVFKGGSNATYEELSAEELTSIAKFVSNASGKA